MSSLTSELKILLVKKVYLRIKQYNLNETKMERDALHDG